MSYRFGKRGSSGAGYWKFVKCETLLQFQCCDYLSKHPDRWKFHHSPNEAKRSRFEQFLMKIMGVSGGFPDLLIYPTGNQGRSPIVIELKYGDNVPTPAQVDWLKFFYRRYYSFVIWSYEAFTELIEGGVRGWAIIDNSYVVLKSDQLPAKIRNKMEVEK